MGPQGVTKSRWPRWPKGVRGGIVCPCWTSGGVFIFFLVVLRLCVDPYFDLRDGRETSFPAPGGRFWARGGGSEGVREAPKPYTNMHFYIHPDVRAVSHHQTRAPHAIDTQGGRGITSRRHGLTWDDHETKNDGDKATATLTEASAICSRVLRWGGCQIRTPGGSGRAQHL